MAKQTDKGRRFDPIEVFEAVDDVAQSDQEAPIWRDTAVGVSYRGRPHLIDRNGEDIGRLNRMYDYSEDVAAELRMIAGNYHAMHEMFQKQWEAALKRAGKFFENA